MNIVFTDRAKADYYGLLPKLKAQADKQLDWLAVNLRYPSLRAKKYNEARDIWQARISRDWRVYFIIDHDSYVLLSIRKHP